MTKLKWDRQNWSSKLNSEYWMNPKTGFDSSWHSQQQNLKKILGIHETHKWEAIKMESGPHAGKLVCKTCNNKFVNWLPKNYFNT
jgi:hypothetical protein